MTTAGFTTSFRASWPYAMRSPSASLTYSEPTIADSSQTRSSCRIGADYPISLQAVAAQVRLHGMSFDREKDRELAYRYDLFVAPDLVERFDALLDEHLTAPTEGRLLEINCGTGGHVIATAALAMEAGEVVGTDASTERIALARAKASAAKIEHASFVEADATALNFESSAFDSVVLDASLDDPARLSPTATEAIRVARKDAPVAIKVCSAGASTSSSPSIGRHSTT